MSEHQTDGPTCRGCKTILRVGAVHCWYCGGVSLKNYNPNSDRSLRSALCGRCGAPLRVGATKCRTCRASPERVALVSESVDAVARRVVELLGEEGER